MYMNNVDHTSMRDITIILPVYIANFLLSYTHYDTELPNALSDTFSHAWEKN
jgi:hypothetical protein